MKTEPIVLFTSCNENYVKHIPTLLMSVKEYMTAYDIQFYFLHTNVAADKLKEMEQFCVSLSVYFEAIEIEEEIYEKYRKLKMLTSKESGFPVEGFYNMLPNLHLPSHVQRALYLDAGDVILGGDISDFYFSDFKGNIITVSKGFARNWSYTADDLYDRQAYLELASEYLNSGSVLFNVALMRKLKIDLEYYMSIVKLMDSMHGGYTWNGFGGGKHYVVQDDQGLLGVAFVGHINFYDPQNIGNLNTSYNFRPFVMECNKQNIKGVEQWSLEKLAPKIIHLLGNKPWTPQEKRKDLLRISQECMELWDTFEKKAKEVTEGLK